MCHALSVYVRMGAGDCVLAEIFQSLVLGCMKFQSLIMYLIQACYICIWAADVSYIAQEKVLLSVLPRGVGIFSTSFGS